MNFGRLTGRAKKLIDERGGMDALKKDAMELKEIATGKGSISDKAKAAAGAIKDPGRAGKDDPTTPAP